MTNGAAAIIHPQQGVESSTAQEPEVAGLGPDVPGAQLVHEPVKKSRSQPLEHSVAVSASPDTDDDIGAVATGVQHVDDGAGRILQVGVK